MRMPSGDYVAAHGKASVDAALAGVTHSGAVKPASARMPWPAHLAPYLWEFLGTYFLVCVAKLAPPGVGPFAVGAILMCMVRTSCSHMRKLVAWAHLSPLRMYVGGVCLLVVCAVVGCLVFVVVVQIFAGGHVSGGVYNPAVTLALVLRGDCPWRRGIGFTVAQLLGGMCGAVSAFGFTHVPGMTMNCIALPPNVTVFQVRCCCGHRVSVAHKCTDPHLLSSTGPVRRVLVHHSSRLRRAECRHGSFSRR